MEFLEFFHKDAKKIRLVDKKRSPMMMVVNFFLVLTNKLKITSIKQFTTRYVTTLGSTIYAHPKWTMDKKTSPLIVHELCHVQQWSFRYALSYALNRRARMNFESTCVQAEMLCYPNLYTNFDAQVSKRAKQFVSYGVPYDMAFRCLTRRWKEVLSGRPQQAAAAIHMRWKRWKKAEKVI